jgi:PadR family transcriptional regulator, regulatory protein PadR
MVKINLPTRIEEVVLTAVAAAADHAYGMGVFEECRNLTGGRYVSIGSIYTILDRLEKKGLVESWFGDVGDPGCHNGKRCFRITEAGIRTVIESADLSRSLRLAWRMIPISLERTGDRRIGAKKALAKSKLEARTHRAG